MQENTENKRLEKSYSYSNTIIDDFENFKNDIISKRIVPYQVEFQPPPSSLKKICWLECSYCYGGSADDTKSPRMEKKLALKILKEIASGGVKKVIFAGYATDPLNSPYIEELLKESIDLNMIFGFNTKALRVSDKLIEQLSRKTIQNSSYLSLSVDAGSDETYNLMHNVKSKARIYNRVVENAKKIRNANEALDLSAAYLINKTNEDLTNIKKFIKDFREAGFNFLRFSFLQQPKDIKLSPIILPNYKEQEKIKDRILDYINSQDSSECKVKLIDVDSEQNIFRKERTTPCFARFIFPTVGYDGWLYNCSQSSAPNFHSIAMGNLAEKNFWDIFYDYDMSDQKNFFSHCSKKIKESGCRCDRKMHLANRAIIKSNVFDIQ
tara:strand:+ start:433 stop:1575 length:1143 start_codon:yes stop_codon:yes gene_type:complete